MDVIRLYKDYSIEVAPDGHKHARPGLFCFLNILLYFYYKVNKVQMKRTRVVIPKNRSGIYQIKSLIDDRVYIGSSINLKTRKKGHFYDLSFNRHHSKYLQRYYNKYGKDNLLFSIIEFCKKDKLIEKEQYWLDLLHPDFNMCKIAGNCLGRKVSEKTKRKISKTLTGRTRIGIKHTEETKIKIGLAGLGRISHNKGKEIPEKTKQKIKNANIKYWNSPEGKKRAKERAKNWWASDNGICKKKKLSTTFMTNEIKQKISAKLKNRVVPEETRRKISETLKKRNNGHNKAVE